MLRPWFQGRRGPRSGAERTRWQVTASPCLQLLDQQCGRGVNVRTRRLAAPHLACGKDRCTFPPSSSAPRAPLVRPRSAPSTAQDRGGEISAFAAAGGVLGGDRARTSARRGPQRGASQKFLPLHCTGGAQSSYPPDEGFPPPSRIPAATLVSHDRSAAPAIGRICGARTCNHTCARACSYDAFTPGPPLSREKPTRIVVG